MDLFQLSHEVPLLQQAPGQNDCGPHAAAMALGFYRPEDANPAKIARQIRFLRIPGLGATLPWGISHGFRCHGRRAVGGWFGTLSDIQSQVVSDRPVIVLVKPTDLQGCRWYSLHYRVVVAFANAPSLPGGGQLYFNCSATNPRPMSSPEAGNLTLDYRTFLAQWQTYLTRQWWIAPAIS